MTLFKGLYSLFQLLNPFLSELDSRAYMALILLPLLLLVSIRNLKYLAPVSMIANLLQFTALGITFYYLFQDIPPISERKYVASWSQFPLYFGTAMYAFDGITMGNLPFIHLIVGLTLFVAGLKFYVKSRGRSHFPCRLH